MADPTSPTPVLLDLDALTDEATVRIDGQPYRLLTMPQVPPLDLHRLGRLGTRMEVLGQQAELSAEEEQEAEALPAQMVALILDAPAVVLKKLTNRQRMRIVETFTMRPIGFLRLPMAPAPEAPAEASSDRTPEASSTPASSSPASSPATVATP